MDLFNLLFRNKNDKNLIPLRFQAGENFNKLLVTIGIKSFYVKVGDDNGENTEKLFLISSKPDNPDIEGFLEGSLTKPHTAKNLMSIGFKQVFILIEDGSGRGSYFDLKDYAK